MLWQQSGSPRGELSPLYGTRTTPARPAGTGNAAFTQPVLSQTGISRRAAEHLLAKFVRYDIVEPRIENHKFYFRMKNEVIYYDLLFSKT